MIVIHLSTQIDLHDNSSVNGEDSEENEEAETDSYPSDSSDEVHVGPEAPDPECLRGKNGMIWNSDPSTQRRRRAPDIVRQRSGPAPDCNNTRKRMENFALFISDDILL